MANKKLFLETLLASIIFFLLFVSLLLLFIRYHLFDFNDRSFKSIIVEGFFVSVIFFVFMFFYTKRRLKKVEKDDH
jgi:Ca2+/Na+ antiporter